MSMSIAVIGAGISGCVAARELLKANHTVYLIEKSVSIGGRLATRRVSLLNNENTYLKADTGAQFITARSEAFKEQFIQPGLDGGYLHVWSVGGFSDTNLENAPITQSDGHPRYSSSLGLNGAVKRSFSDLFVHSNCNIHLNTRVNSISWDDKTNFKLKLDNQDDIECNHVFITLPLPQVIPIIKNVQLSHFKCNISNILELAASKSYDPCLCLIIVLPAFLAKTLISSHNGAKRIANDPIIQWMASNNSKGMTIEESEGLDAVTLHCNAEFSKENYGLSDTAISEMILSSPLLQTYRDNIQSLSVKKWKYAVPLFDSASTSGRDSLEDAEYVSFFSKNSSTSLHLMGDSYTKQPRVEASFLSALKCTKAFNSFNLPSTLIPGHKHEMGNLSHVDATTWKGQHWPKSVTGVSNSPFGTTRYTFLGPEDGPKLVFIHGITASACTFPAFIQGLADSGFRVLVYDLFGRGFSAAPGAHYNDSLYVSQLYFLCTDLKWDSFHLVGLSLGGATAFAVQYSEKIKSLSLIAPAGLLQRLPLIAHALQTPIIGPVIWHSFGQRVLVKISESNFRNHATDAVVRAKLMTADHIRLHPGFLRAYYSTVEHFPLTSMESQYAQLESILHKRVGVIWGIEDTVIPFSLLPKFQSLVPSAHIFEFQNEGHSIVVENPKACVDSIKSLVEKS